VLARVDEAPYHLPAQSSLIRPKGPEQSLVSPGDIAANGWRHDPAGAVRILEQDLHATKRVDVEDAGTQRGSARRGLSRR